MIGVITEVDIRKTKNRITIKTTKPVMVRTLPRAIIMQEGKKPGLLSQPYA